MKSYKLYIIIFTLSLFSCVEKYEFSVKNKKTGISIDAFISNKSYTNTVDYPSDGRFFTVKLSSISDVTNVSDNKISHAIVTLIDDENNHWNYFEDNNNPGEYILNNIDFKAVYGVKYKIKVETPSGEIFESNWESMPVEDTFIGEINIEESTVYKNTWIDNGEKVIRQPYPGIYVKVKLPEVSKEDSTYYRWDFEPLWIYIAPYASDNSSIKKCWVTSDYYLNDFTLEKVNKGNYDKNLFFLETKNNNKVYEYFSALIIQKSISKDYYNYHKELQEQGSDGGGIYPQAPYNLRGNFSCTNGESEAVGYFGVYTENSTRWVFDESKLSYGINNDLKEICESILEFPIPTSPCLNCLYTNGNSENTPPEWWNKD